MKKLPIVLAGTAIAVVLGVVGLVSVQSGPDPSTGNDNTFSDAGDSGPSQLRFPPPTPHSHTYESWDGERATEVQTQYDEFADETETSVEIRDFADEFFSLDLLARQQGADGVLAPESVTFVFKTRSVYGPPLEGASELRFLFDGQRLSFAEVEREDSTSPSTESLAAQFTELQRMNEHLETIKREGRELAAGRMPAGGLTRRDADDFKVEVLHDTDYWVELSWELPIAEFLNVVNADSVRGRIDVLEFTVGSEELNVMRDFASRLAPSR